MDTALPPRDHNNPPDPLIVEADGRIDTANKWLTERAEITDAEMADKAAFFISQVDATYKALDGQRMDEKRVFLADQDKKYKTPLSLLERAKDKLVVLRRVWLKKEQDRIDAERAAAQKKIDDARKAAEEAQARADKEAAKKKGGDVLRTEIAAEEAKAAIAEAEEAAAAVPDRAQIKGAYTTKAVGLRDYWSAEISDLSEAFKYYNAKKNPHRATLAAAIRETIQGIADKEAKLLKDKTKAPPGITFNMEKR